MAISSLEVEHLAVTFPNPTLYKLVVGVNVSTTGGPCLCVSPVIDSRPVQDVPRLSPYGNWDSFQPPAHDPNWISGREKRVVWETRGWGWEEGYESKFSLIFHKGSWRAGSAFDHRSSVLYQTDRGGWAHRRFKSVKILNRKIDRWSWRTFGGKWVGRREWGRGC